MLTYPHHKPNNTTYQLLSYHIQDYTRKVYKLLDTPC